ncbi:hypothetical protein, partial [Thiolapillus sp.]
PRSEAYFVFPLAQGTPGKQCGLAATGDYQPSLRSPWLAAEPGMPDLDPKYDELKLKSRVSDRAKLMAVLLAQDDMFLDELQTRAAALLV